MINEKWSFREERLGLIYQMIQEKASVTVSELARQFNISESTVRLDLTALEESSLIKRTHGGAIILDEPSSNALLSSESIKKRINFMTDEKKAIGLKASTLIEDGDTLMIDGGSTTSFVIKNIKQRKNLTVITNSFLIIEDLISQTDVNLFILGGLTFHKHGITVGGMTNNDLASFFPNKTILGIDGLSVDRGLMCEDPSVPAVAAVKSEMVRISEQLIIVCDHTKINKSCPMFVAPIEKVDYLITDNGIDKEDYKAITQKGPKILIAD